jgi:hypothetical protein
MMTERDFARSGAKLFEETLHISQTVEILSVLYHSRTSFQLPTEHPALTRTHYPSQ